MSEVGSAGVARRSAWALPLLTAAAVGTLFFVPLYCPDAMPVSVWWSADSVPAVSGLIFWDYRVPRICLAFLAGSGLAVGGLAFQSLFRNPLAEPFTLGVSGGAALGATVYLLYLSGAGAAFTVGGLSGKSLCAFTGAAAATLLVYGLTRLRGGFSIHVMLVAGVAVSFFCSGLILFMQYLADFTQAHRIIFWLMGGLQSRRFENVLNVLPFTAVGVAAVLCYGRELNVLTTGDDLAAARGVEVRFVRRLLFFAVALTVGGIVAVCGPIGFVGLMAPHICRLLVGPDHRRLTPATILFGGTFLALCDAAARTLIYPAEMPVGIVTSVLGGPFFLWLLLRRKRETEF